MPQLCNIPKLKIFTLVQREPDMPAASSAPPWMAKRWLLRWQLRCFVNHGEVPAFGGQPPIVHRNITPSLRYRLFLRIIFNAMAILELNHLKKYFATQKAVDDISLTIDRGQIFGLLGPNGAGKTTLIRMITGIFYPDEGQIIFDGKRFDPINDIVHIGYIPEERGLYKKMKIGEQTLYRSE